MVNRIYVDNAATTALSSTAYDAMVPYLSGDYGNASQLYSFARNPKKALKEARAAIADNIGAYPEEIFFTSCGTESDNWAIFGAATQRLPIITSAIEHHAILRPCNYFASKGADIKILPVDNNGIVSKTTLEDIQGNGKALVSIMFANNEIGSIEPICDLSEVAHSRGFLFHTDAVQAVGHVAINVKNLNVDMLSASAHKFNGPKGIGFLYIKKDLVWPSLIMGGSQEYGHRAGTENVASIVGMAVALNENVINIYNNTKHISELEDCLLSQLIDARVSFIRNGSKDRTPGNVSISFLGVSGESLLHRLDLQGIYVSTGSACNSKETELSHVLTAIGLNKEIASGTIRISLGKNNTKEEAIRIGKVLSMIISKQD